MPTENSSQVGNLDMRLTIAAHHPTTVITSLSFAASAEEIYVGSDRAL